MVSATARGLGLVALAGFVFVLFIVSIRLVGTSLNPVQAAFLRYAFGFLVLLPMMARQGGSVFYTRYPLRHALRGGVHGLGVLLWFYAITSLPIFVTIGAVMFLGEQLRLTTVVALVCGFAGVLIIVRPGFESVGAGAVAILCSAPLFACSQLLVKSLVREDSSVTTVLYLSLFAMLTMLVPALAVWQSPTVTDLLLLAMAAGFATLSHVLLAQGLKWVDITLVQPADFLRLVWSALFGFVLFDEIPGLWVWVGSAVVVASVTLTARSAFTPSDDRNRDR